MSPDSKNESTPGCSREVVPNICFEMKFFWSMLIFSILSIFCMAMTGLPSTLGSRSAISSVGLIPILIPCF